MRTATACRPSVRSSPPSRTLGRTSARRCETQGRRVVDTLARAGAMDVSPEPLSDDLLREAFGGLRRSFDHRWGGFGGAPKFPQPMTLEFLLRCHLRGYEDAPEMLQTTLDRMAAGGMYDQVGGGFHRYSTDAMWLVPHFEKMLYDNAQLARVYARAWQVTRQRAVPAGGHRDLRLPAPRDAASRRRVLLLAGCRLRRGRGQVLRVVPRRADLGRGRGGCGCVRGDAVRQLGGDRTCYGVRIRSRRLPRNSGSSRSELERDVEAARSRLFEIREQRVRPATDDKVLAAWNGLAISALAEAGRAFGEPRYVDAAVQAARLRADATARRRRPAAPVVAGRQAWTARLRGRPRADGRGLPDPVRDHVRAPVVRGGSGRSPTTCSGCSGTGSAAGSSRPARTPRPW